MHQIFVDPLPTFRFSHHSHVKLGQNQHQIKIRVAHVGHGLLPAACYSSALDRPPLNSTPHQLLPKTLSVAPPPASSSPVTWITSAPVSPLYTASLAWTVTVARGWVWVGSGRRSHRHGRRRPAGTVAPSLAGPCLRRCRTPLS